MMIMMMLRLAMTLPFKYSPEDPKTTVAIDCQQLDSEDDIGTRGDVVTKTKVTVGMVVADLEGRHFPYCHHPNTFV